MTSNSGFRYSSIRKLMRLDVLPVALDLDVVDAERGVLAEDDLLAERARSVGLQELVEHLLALRVAHDHAHGPRPRAAWYSSSFDALAERPPRCGSDRPGR